MSKIFVLSLIFGSFCCGILWQNSQKQMILAQASRLKNKVIVRATGSASSSKRPEESDLFTIFTEDNPQNSIRTIPEGKKLVVTDMMFDARYTEQDLVINLAQRIEDKDSLNYKKNEPLQQFSLKAGESKENHLCTGYVIHAGNGINAWTNANLKPKQLVIMNFTGYLVDENEED